MQEVGLSDRLREDVAAFAAGNRRLSNPKGCFDRCLGTMSRLAEYLAARGHDASGIRMAELSVRMPDADPRWRKVGGEFWWVHYAVLAEGHVIDFTFRQFAPRTEWPLVRPVEDVLDEWEDCSDMRPGPRGWVRGGQIRHVRANSGVVTPAKC